MEAVDAVISSAVVTLGSYGLPLLKSIVILALGIYVGKFLAKITKEILKAVKIRDILSSFGVSSSLLGIDVVEATSAFVEFYTYFYFLIQALAVLNLGALVGFVFELKNFALAVFEAFLIALVGFSISNGVKVRLEDTLGNKMVAEVVRWSLYYITAILALSSVFPEASELLKLLFYALLIGLGGGLALGIGIALGLGTKDYVAKLIETQVKK